MCNTISRKKAIESKKDRGASCSLGVEQETREHQDHDGEEFDHTNSDHCIHHEIFLQSWVACNTTNQTIEDDTETQSSQTTAVDGKTSREHANTGIALLCHDCQRSCHGGWFDSSHWSHLEEAGCSERLHCDWWLHLLSKASST